MYITTHQRAINGRLTQSEQRRTKVGPWQVRFSFDIHDLLVPNWITSNSISIKSIQLVFVKWEHAPRIGNNAKGFTHLIILCCKSRKNSESGGYWVGGRGAGFLNFSAV